MVDITKLRRNIADAYLTYALALKVFYIISVVLLWSGYQVFALVLFGLTIACNMFTDTLVFDTVRRSRTRLVGWRMFAYTLGGLPALEKCLEEYALVLARRRGSLDHWERRFSFVRTAFERVGHKRRGDGSIAFYLPRDDESEMIQT